MTYIGTTHTRHTHVPARLRRSTTLRNDYTTTLHLADVTTDVRRRGRRGCARLLDAAGICCVLSFMGGCRLHHTPYLHIRSYINAADAVQESVVENHFADTCFCSVDGGLRLGSAGRPREQKSYNSSSNCCIHRRCDKVAGVGSLRVRLLQVIVIVAVAVAMTMAATTDRHTQMDTHLPPLRAPNPH